MRSMIVEDWPRKIAWRRFTQASRNLAFSGLGRIGLDEAAVRVRQVHAKIMEPALLARDIRICLAKIRLRVARSIAQWHEHLASAV